MRKRMLVAVLAVVTVGWPVAAAQAQGEDNRRSRGVAESFDELQLMLEPGRKVLVRDEAGREIRGRVSSLKGDRLAILRPQRLLGAFRRPQELEFAEASVVTIEVVDSVWNGALLGGAAGATALGLWAGNCHSGECTQGRALYAVVGTGLAVAAGAIFDARRNRRLYQRPLQSPRTTLTPLLGRERLGLMAEFRF